MPSLMSMSAGAMPPPPNTYDLFTVHSCPTNAASSVSPQLGRMGANDGSDTPGSLEVTSGTGAYRPEPPSGSWAWPGRTTLPGSTALPRHTGRHG